MKLHHENDGVADDHGHDEVLKGRRGDESPDAVLDAVLVLRHEQRPRPGIQRKVDALLLQGNSLIIL